MIWGYPHFRKPPKWSVLQKKAASVVETMIPFGAEEATGVQSYGDYGGWFLQFQSPDSIIHCGSSSQSKVGVNRVNPCLTIPKPSRLSPFLWIHPQLLVLHGNTLVSHIETHGSRSKAARVTPQPLGKNGEFRTFWKGKSLKQN